MKYYRNKERPSLEKKLLFVIVRSNWAFVPVMSANYFGVCVKALQLRSVLSLKPQTNFERENREKISINYGRLCDRNSIRKQSKFSHANYLKQLT